MASVNLDLEEGEGSSERNGLIERIKHITRIILDCTNPCVPASLTATKDSVISKLKWCKQNKLQACFYVGIILYPGGLFAAQGSYYLRMVNYVAPCLTALPAVTRFHEHFRNLEQIRDIGDNLQRLEQSIRELSASLDGVASVGRTNQVVEEVDPNGVGRCEMCKTNQQLV